jgi:hypothetical protein
MGAPRRVGKTKTFESSSQEADPTPETDQQTLAARRNLGNGARADARYARGRSHRRNVDIVEEALQAPGNPNSTPWLLEKARVIRRSTLGSREWPSSWRSERYACRSIRHGSAAAAQADLDGFSWPFPGWCSASMPAFDAVRATFES